MIQVPMIFQKDYGTKSEWGSNFGSFGKIFTCPKWLQSWGPGRSCKAQRPTSEPFWPDENLSK